MSTIIIGVDASERSEDAIAFGRRLANVADAPVVVANAYPYSADPGRASSEAYRIVLRDDALETVETMREQLDRVVDAPTMIKIVADPSPAKALHHLAHAERASLVIVGSSHTGRAGRVLPGSTAERLLHGSPCAVAVVPKDYRARTERAIHRIGVAYNDSDEARAALSAAIALARALQAEVEIISVISPESITARAVTGTGVPTLSRDVERHVQHRIDAALSEVPEGVTAHGRKVTGDAEELLTSHSENLDLLVMGSRGYGPLHSVLVGGVSGRLLRCASCPVIVVPRGIEAPLQSLFDDSAATVA